MGTPGVRAVRNVTRSRGVWLGVTLAVGIVICAVAAGVRTGPATSGPTVSALGPAAELSTPASPSNGSSRAGPTWEANRWSPRQGGAFAPADMAGCRAESLRLLPGGNYGTATSAAGGHVVGVAGDALGRARPVVWRQNSPDAINAGLVASVPADVNSRGDVVGTGTDPKTGAPVGWFWSGGRTIRLPAPEDQTALPAAINGRGVIVGVVVEVEDASDEPNDNENEQPAVWRSPAAAPVLLAPLKGDQGGHAFAMSPQGLIGGVSEGDRFTPVMWDAAGRLRALPNLGGGWGAVRAFDSTGTPVGESAVASGDVHLVKWDAAGTIHDLGLGSVQTYLAQVGTIAVAAGYSTDSVGTRHPVTWRCH
jgi:hypothetical protein